MSILNINTSRNTNITPLTTTSLSQYVPREIWQHICSYLGGVQDIISIGLTNHQFSVQIFQNSSIWNSILQRRFPDSRVDCQSEAKGLALCRHLSNIEKNRKTGRYRSQLIAGSEVANIFGALLSKDQLLLGLKDGYITIFDFKSGKQLQLSVYRGNVTNILMNENRLILILGNFRTRNNVIKVFDMDLQSVEELYTVETHQRAIGDILVHKNHLICTFGNTIEIFDLTSGQKVDTLAGHVLYISSILVHENNLISASADSIRIWDLDNGQAIQTLAAPPHGTITTMLAYENKIISCSGSGTINIWDLQSGRELQTIAGHQNPVKKMLIHDNQLFFISSDKVSDFIKIWDLKNGKEIQVLRKPAHGPIDDFFIYKNQLIIRSEVAEIWDFSIPPSFYTRQFGSDSPLLILEEIAQDATRAEVFAELLDPDIQQRLKQHAFNVGTPSTYSAPVILRVQTEVCVEELLDAIYKGDQGLVSELLDLLVKIDAQNKEIYRLLWQVCGSDESVIWGWGEFAFHNREGCTASLLQKAEAIDYFKKHLKERWGKDVPLSLLDLGITAENCGEKLLLDLGITAEDCGEKLKCSPDFLQKIGILSSTDIKALNRNIIKYPEISAEEVTEKYDQLQIQTVPNEDVAYVFLEILSIAVNQRVEECKVLFDKEKWKWMHLRGKLECYQDAFLERPQDFLGSPEAYAGFVEKANGLMKTFHKLDQKLQIAKLRNQITNLRTYVTQDREGILRAWERLHGLGIISLADLLKRPGAPHDPFHMGE
jgi:WD40 repeat protein